MLNGAREGENLIGATFRKTQRLCHLQVVLIFILHGRLGNFGNYHIASFITLLLRNMLRVISILAQSVHTAPIE